MSAVSGSGVPEAPSSVAARSDLPAHVRELLAEQLAELSRQLEPLLHGSLIAFRHQIGKQGERSRNSVEEQNALHGMQQAKRLDGQIMDVFRRTFDQKLAVFDQTIPASAHKPALDGGLSLINNQEFEESVLLDDIATRAETRAGRQLFELGYRHGVLAAKAPFEAEELALGPHGLMHGLGEIARAHGFSREHRLFWYRLLDPPLVGAADEAYAALNHYLMTQGILDSLRPYLPRRGSAPRTRSSAATPDANSAAQPGDAGLQSLRPLLARRRELLKLEDGPSDAQPAAVDTVQAALAALQQRVLTRAQPDATGVQRTMQGLHQEVLAELRSVAPDSKGLRLADEQRDVFDLVSLWFERLLEETHDDGSAQRLLARLLARLQIPLLRVALADASVFQRGTHPARRLLNIVVETADLWIDGSEGEPDHALLDKLRHTADYILAHFNGDPALFEQQAMELENQLSAMRRRAEVAERRQRDAAQGRERLESARSQAGAAITALIAGGNVGTLTRALLEQAWTDALALSILRHGAGSEEFSRTLEVAGELLRPPGQRDESRLLIELEQGLVQVGLHASEASQLAHRVLDREVPGDEKSTQTELLVKLKTRPRLGEQDGGGSNVAAPLNEDERRHLSRLRALPFNTWFECTLDAQGRRAQRKLIWHGESGRCLLVNARGASAAECSLEQLARQMAAGQMRLLPRQEQSLVDRAWHTVVASVRQFGRAGEMGGGADSGS